MSSLWVAGRRVAIGSLRRGGIFVLAPLLVLYEVILDRKSLLVFDAQEYFVPKYLEVARQWRQGILPVWDPTVFSGSPLLGGGQAGVFYPPNLLYIFCPTLVVYQALLIGHMVLGGIGARLLARRLVGSEWGASISGAAYSISGYSIVHLTHASFFAGIAWLPWILLGIDLVVDCVSVKRVALLAGAVAMAGLGGHPQYFWMDLVALVGFFLFRLDMRRGWVRSTMAVGMGVVLGAMIAAPQLITTKTYSGVSGRPSLSFAGSMQYFMPLTHLPLMAFPFLYGSDPPSPMFNHPYAAPPLFREFASYPGMVVLVLALMGFRRRRGNRGLRAMIFVGGLSIFLALGTDTPFAHWWYRLVPPSHSFRIWPRHLYVTSLALAVFAGAGVAELLHDEDGRKARALRRGVMGLAGLAMLGWWTTKWQRAAKLVAPGSARIAALFVPLGFGAAALLVATMWVTRPRHRLSRAWVLPSALVVVVIADLGVFAWSTEWRTFAMPIAAARAYPHQKGDLAFGPVVDAPGGIDRAANESGTYTNSNTTKGVLSVNGYDPIFPKDYGVALGDMNQYGGVYRPDIWSAHTWVADLLRVTTLALNTAGTNGTESLGPVWTKLRLAVGYPETVWTRQPRLNDVFTVGEVRVTTFLGAVAALRGDGSVPGVIPPLPTLDASQTALVDGSCAECRGLGAPGPAGEVQAVSRSPNRWRAAVTMRRAGLVVFSRAYLPGTHASVDRHSVPVRRVDALVSGFVVPAGPHRIAIWYEAPGLKLGALLAMVGLLSLLGWAIVEHRRVSRAESAGSPTPGGSVAAFRLTTSPAGSP